MLFSTIPDKEKTKTKTKQNCHSAMLQSISLEKETQLSKMQGGTDQERENESLILEQSTKD